MKNCRLARTHLYVSVFILICSLCPKDNTWGAVPPPPANQFIGMVDSLFQNPIEAECRACHDSGLPDRHHLLYGMIIPDPTSAPFGTPGSPYGCSSCHAEDISSGSIVFRVERDCLACHLYIPEYRLGSVHHVTDAAAERHCSNCHGSVVQDFDDDHYIPDYDISDITPDPDCKTWDGPICVSGGCTVCHAEDLTAVPVINANNDLHHSVRISCLTCHQMHGNIRDCESCHGPDSLHNIQADSDNPANIGIIIPGQEDLGWGHIGNSWDCFGCHESFNGASVSGNSGMFSASSTPQTGATIPYMYGMNTFSVTAGKDTVLHINGSGFINETGGVTYLSDVVVENGVDTLTLERASITVNSIEVTVPSTLPVGLYDIRIRKDDKLSNKDIVAVIPEVRITDVSCNRKKGVLTVSGSGFGEKPVGTGAYINMQIDGQTADIISWADTLIKAPVSGCRGDATVTVNALMGSATSGGGGKPEKPCNAKKCN